MKDKQVETAAKPASIPIISPILHCVAMTVIVYLRTGFGFAYLRPKSIFISLSWAVVLFSFIIWNEPVLRRQYWAVSLFALGAVILYTGNLVAAFRRELSNAGKHDYYSGYSHLGKFSQASKTPISEKAEMSLHLWAEPGVVVALSAFLRMILRETHLSAWLFFAALCLWLKEAFNYWHQLRRRKHHEDIFEDAVASTELPQPHTAPSEPPKATRTRRTKRQRFKTE